MRRPTRRRFAACRCISSPKVELVVDAAAEKIFLALAAQDLTATNLQTHSLCHCINFRSKRIRMASADFDTRFAPFEV
jgi:hypothetical protein